VKLPLTLNTTHITLSYVISFIHSPPSAPQTPFRSLLRAVGTPQLGVIKRETAKNKIRKVKIKKTCEEGK
jgi:hypothetical protein